MSDRERWIIYPLLFAALCFGVKQQHQPETLRCRSIECNDLKVLSLNNNIGVSMTATEAAGTMVLYSQNRPSVRLRSVFHREQGNKGFASSYGSIEAMDARGRPIATIKGNVDGGLVRLEGNRQPTVLLGHDHTMGLAGLVALDNRDDPVESVPADENVWGIPLPKKEPVANEQTTEQENEQGTSGDGEQQDSASDDSPSTPNAESAKETQVNADESEETAQAEPQATQPANDENNEQETNQPETESTDSENNNPENNNPLLFRGTNKRS